MKETLKFNLPCQTPSCLFYFPSSQACPQHLASESPSDQEPATRKKTEKFRWGKKERNAIKAVMMQGGSLAIFFLARSKISSSTLLLVTKR
jgi:hypothetical protein